MDETRIYRYPLWLRNHDVRFHSLSWSGAGMAGRELLIHDSLQMRWLSRARIKASASARSARSAKACRIREDGCRPEAYCAAMVNDHLNTCSDTAMLPAEAPASSLDVRLLPAHRSCGGPAFLSRDRIVAAAADCNLTKGPPCRTVNVVPISARATPSANTSRRPVPPRPRIFIIERPTASLLAASLVAFALVAVGAFANNLLSAPRNLACEAPARAAPR